MVALELEVLVVQEQLEQRLHLKNWIPGVELELTAATKCAEVIANSNKS